MSRAARGEGAIGGLSWSDSSTEVAVTVTPGVYGGRARGRQRGRGGGRPTGLALPRRRAGFRASRRMTRARDVHKTPACRYGMPQPRSQPVQVRWDGVRHRSGDQCGGRGGYHGDDVWDGSGRGQRQTKRF
ncbi:hypothetical protein GCM10010378_03620 [Streptomyces viridochromogenes]